jgi:Xaa-Pro aminopeptidase
LAPVDRNLIDPSLLEDEEISWLDAYHQRVRETLTPIVDQDTAGWLDQATKPIGGG